MFTTFVAEGLLPLGFGPDEMDRAAEVGGGR